MRQAGLPMLAIGRRITLYEYRCRAPDRRCPIRWRSKAATHPGAGTEGTLFSWHPRSRMPRGAAPEYLTLRRQDRRSPVGRETFSASRAAGTTPTEWCGAVGAPEGPHEVGGIVVADPMADLLH